MSKKFLFGIVAAFCTLLIVSAAPWEELQGCTLVENAYKDGDSFHVMHNGQEYIMRLYFVDTPETNTQFPDRVAEQAAYFGCSIERVLEVGEEASVFTTNILKGKIFTIYTRWQDAMGQSALPRYYGMVVVDGDYLSSILVANGLARVYGKRITLPDGTTSKEYREELFELEAEAQDLQKGGRAPQANGQ